VLGDRPIALAEGRENKKMAVGMHLLVAGKDTSPDVLLAQLVRFASLQWDQAGRSSTRAGVVITVAATVLGATVVLLSGLTLPVLYIVVAGWILLVCSIILAGWAVSQREWSSPPSLRDTDLEAGFLAQPEAVKEGLVLDFAQACRENDGYLKQLQNRGNWALVALTIGMLVIGLAYLVVKL
jgi:hypothetical protein